MPIETMTTDTMPTDTMPTDTTPTDNMATGTLITVKLFQVGSDLRAIEVEDGTTVEQFLTEQDMQGKVYRNGPEAAATDILQENDTLMVVADKAVKGA